MLPSARFAFEGFPVPKAFQYDGTICPPRLAAPRNLAKIASVIVEREQNMHIISNPVPKKEQRVAEHEVPRVLSKATAMARDKEKEKGFPG